MAETTDQYKNRISQIKTSIENEPEIVKMREDIAEGISKTGNRQADIEVRQGTLEEDFVKVQQDASSVSPSGAEVAVARGEYSTLDGRLTAEQNKVNAQLAQTEDNVNRRVDELVINSGDANAEITDAHVSTTKQKSFNTIKNRFEDAEKDIYLPWTNAIKNGDLSKGTADWHTQHSVITSDNNKLYVTGTGANAAARIFQTSSIPYIAKKKVFYSVKVKVTNAVCSLVTFQIRDSSIAKAIVVETIKLPDENVQYHMSGVVTVPESLTGNITFFLTHEYSDGITAKDKVMEVQEALFIDITAPFGIGNEPEESQVKAMLSKHPNGWFDGTKNVLWGKQLISKQLELENEINNMNNVPLQKLRNQSFDFVDSGDYLFEPSTYTGGQAGYTSIIQMDDKIDDPIDKFYMYWAGHDGGGIRLSTAPHPLGPWTFYPDASTALIHDGYFGPSRHLSSPDVIYDDATEKFYLFYHSALVEPMVQSTWRAESSDGLVFVNPIEILPAVQGGAWDGEERSYLRVIKSGGYWHAVYQGRNKQYSNDPHAHIGYAVSEDLLEWNRYPSPLWRDNNFTLYEDGWKMTEFLGGTPCLFEYDGTVWVFYTNGEYKRHIYAAPLDLESNEVKPKLILEAPAWAGGLGIEGPNFLEYENKIYMYFNDVGSSQLSRRVGVAIMNLGVK